MALDGGFRRRRRETRYCGRFTMVADIVETPAGDTIERESIAHPGAAVIVAHDAGDILFIRQYRAAIDRVLLELPAGKIDWHDGVPDSPADTAARELQEETGYFAGEIELVGELWMSPGLTDERMYCFRANGLKRAERNPQTPEESAAEIIRIPEADAYEMVFSGEICDAKSIVALGYAR